MEDSKLVTTCPKVAVNKSNCCIDVSGRLLKRAVRLLFKIIIMAMGLSQGSVFIAFNCFWRMQ